MRIDKFLADNSIGTRKEIKAFIKEGRVLANGKAVTDPGMHIDPASDEVRFDGVVIEYEKFHYYMLNKPAGTVSSTKEGASVTVIELLADEGVKNLSPVGRLDKDTEGLLILTDDGELLHEDGRDNSVDNDLFIHATHPRHCEVVTLITRAGV